MRTVFRASAEGVTQKREPNTVRFTDKPTVAFPRVLTPPAKRTPELLAYMETKSDLLSGVWGRDTA